MRGGGGARGTEPWRRSGGARGGGCHGYAAFWVWVVLGFFFPPVEGDAGTGPGPGEGVGTRHAHTRDGTGRDTTGAATGLTPSPFSPLPRSLPAVSCRGERGADGERGERLLGAGGLGHRQQLGGGGGGGRPRRQLATPPDTGKGLLSTGKCCLQWARLGTSPGVRSLGDVLLGPVALGGPGPQKQRPVDV